MYNIITLRNEGNVDLKLRIDDACKLQGMAKSVGENRIGKMISTNNMTRILFFNMKMCNIVLYEKVTWGYHRHFF